MKTLLIALILASMAATICVAGVELATATNSELFIKFFGFASFLIVDVCALTSIIRNKDNENK